MKAISIKQPWASLMFTPNKTTGIIEGLKSIETRTWRTSYRGPLLICASAAIDTTYKPLEELTGICRVCGCHEEETCVNTFGDKCKLGEDLCDQCYNIVGHAIGIVTVVACRPMEPSDRLQACMEYQEGLFAWEVENPKQLLAPFPVKGKLNFFNVDHPEGIFQTRERFDLMELS